MKPLTLLLFSVFILVSCAPSQAATSQPVSETLFSQQATPMDDPVLHPTLFPNAGGDRELSRLDEQGAVVFEVTPLNLGTPAETLQFEVAMNTHSVDLSMDLAALSTLTADTGLVVQALQWDATPGGHHVAGTLIFPSEQNGRPILQGADKLVLTIINVDAPVRAFEWELE